MPTPTEAQTRIDLIDPALVKVGWEVNNVALVRREIPVDEFDPMAWNQLAAKINQLKAQHQIYEGPLPAGICDYALYHKNGDILAIVEAKRTSVDPRLAQAQAEFYVNQIEKRQGWRPFAFMTNGRRIYFLDAGEANKREVAGFFSPQDLENLLYLRQNRKPLTSIAINTAITNRLYQQEAVRRVCEAFEQGKRRALIIMATGTGKTRTAMSLVDVFLKANQARRVLFVADRDELVKQALNDGFKKHLPDEPNQRIHSGKVDTTKRLYVATLQTMSNCFAEFTPGFFDLIIFDEVHRSIFNKWNEVLEYFDARMVGLTATPADFIDRNTFLEFGCTDGTPTYLYTYQQAVNDKFLVDFSLYVMQTRFQREGIHAVNLSEEEKNALLEQGLDPDDIDYSGTELERSVSNRDTLRRQWQEIWDKCVKDKSGQLPGKMIVFAMTQDHALRLEEVFNEMFPQFPGLVRTITYKSDYKGQLIEKFKKESLPRIAVTVDLLETGIDVPEVVNLVFMRSVQSRIKLWQMIGRGTRSQAACQFMDWLPEGEKKEFVILDFWENDFNKSPEKEAAQSLPVLVSLFNTRLNLLEHYVSRPSGDEFKRTVADLRAQIALIPTDSFSVKKIYPEVEEAWRDEFWAYVNPKKVEFLRMRVGPLLRYAVASDVAAATFTNKMERLKLQSQTGQSTTATIGSIRDDVSRLKDTLLPQPAQKAMKDFCLSSALEAADPAQLDQVADTLAPLMKNKSANPESFLLLDLKDAVALSGYILLKGGTEKIYVTDYRERVEKRILGLMTHPTIDAISRGQPVTDERLLELERTLRQTLGEGDLELVESNIRKAFGVKVGSLIEFVRQILELDGVPDYAEIVRHQFSEYVAAHPFNADQTRFLNVLQNVFIQKRRMVLADLYEPPLSNLGQDAVERWFTPEQVREILAFAETLAV